MICNGGCSEHQASTTLWCDARCSVTQQALLLRALINPGDVKRLGVLLLR